jgi:hypothetical protein
MRRAMKVLGARRSGAICCVYWLLPALGLFALAACAQQVSPRLAPGGSWTLWSAHWSPEYGQQEQWTRVEVFETRSACDDRRRSYLHSTEKIGRAQGWRSLRSANMVYTLDMSSLRVLRRERLWCSDAELARANQVIE